MNRVQPFVGRRRQDRHGLAPDRRRPTTLRRPGRAVLGHDHLRRRPAAPRSRKGAKVVMSPANKAYLDMKYTNHDPARPDLGRPDRGADRLRLGPGAYLLPACRPSAVLGVEAPLWTETIVTLADIEFMAFPRLPAIAELGWSPQSTHNWDTFKVRLGAQGPRWTVQGINFYRSPQVPWATAPPSGRVEAESFTVAVRRADRRRRRGARRQPRRLHRQRGLDRLLRRLRGGPHRLHRPGGVGWGGRHDPGALRLGHRPAAGLGRGAQHRRLRHLRRRQHGPHGRNGAAVPGLHRKRRRAVRHRRLRPHRQHPAGDESRAEQARHLRQPVRHRRGTGEGRQRHDQRRQRRQVVLRRRRQVVARRPAVQHRRRTRRHPPCRGRRGERRLQHAGLRHPDQPRRHRLDHCRAGPRQHRQRHHHHVRPGQRRATSG